MHRNKKILDKIILTAVFLIMLTSFVFVVAEARHDCDHQDCSICFQITQSEKIIKDLSLFIMLSSTVKFIVNHSEYFPLIISTFNKLFTSLTLISLKVKFNN